MTERTRVLLTGASGLLGTWLGRTAPASVGMVSVVHQTPVAGDLVLADLRDRGAVERAFATVAPDLVIHAAYARDEASIVGSARHVVEAAADSAAAVLLVSSEAVFSGDGRPRSESSSADPVWDYGRWKAAAEDVALRLAPGTAVVRLPLVISADPEDHIVRDVRLGAAGGSPSVWFTDERRQPANADELAQAIWRIAALSADRRAGVWHLPGPERLSRFDIAARTVDALGLDRSTISAAPTPDGARRPRDLHLTGERARREIGWNPGPVLSSR